MKPVLIYFSAATLGVVFFRGVGVVGVASNKHAPSKPASRNDEEKATTGFATRTDTKMLTGESESRSDVLEVNEMGV